MKIVGGMKISPFVFYSMTIREAKLAIKGHKEEMHEQYIANLYATINAIGSCFGGKKFKAIDPYENNEANDKEHIAQQASMLRALGVDPKDFVGSNNNKDDWSQLSTEEKRKLLFGDNKQ
jgi:hypothetical protein